MNGIDDLRRTLETHADDVLDVTAADRGAGIQRRIRTTRRRRTAVAGATAAVVAATALVAFLPGDRDSGPDAAGPTVFGIDLPATIDSLGFTYDYDEHVRGEERAVLRLEASDEPRLVSWGTSTDDDRVTVEVGAGGERRTFDGADFTDWTYVAPGEAVRVSARVGTGDVSLAAYTLGEPRPEGVSADGVTYRDAIAGGTLLGAAVGEPGQAEVVVEPVAALDGRTDVFYASYCAGAPAGAFLHVATADGEVVSGGGCDDSRVPVDPAVVGGMTQAVGPRQDLATRFYVTDGEDGPLVEDDDLRVGLGLYAQDAPRDLGDGIELPERVEHDGHAWQLVETASPDLGPDGAAVAVPDLDGRTLALIAYTRADDSRITYEVDGDDSSSVSYVGGGTFTADLPAGAAEVALVRLGGAPVPAEAAVGFGFYVLAD
ncbi:hypothetical protein FE634_21490 [Nocardioides dongxiaopingii]|uniref:hypothetical protein n=1 Tax=Nocardioides sp. S-1144 TaxID=2582905 RepID=UPI0011656717|nr:hypothetical protein [Nocardioides sp. S-1144]QDH10701.1 hypothetical protein FE634_21490 [Nocardioides sp. S-1144]